MSQSDKDLCEKCGCTRDDLIHRKAEVADLRIQFALIIGVDEESFHDFVESEETPCQS